MKISAYQNDVVAPMFRNAKLNLDLASKVLLSKQQQFDQNYQALQNLKADSLSIKFLNKASQSKIDAYNSQIAKDFPDISSGNFDLSNSDITSKYMNNFKRIANDTELINNFKKDRQVQQSLQSLNDMKNQKDPLKAGYHPINEANFMNEVQSYIDATGDISNMNVSYTPYIDTTKEMASLTKTIPKEKNQSFQMTQDGMGIIKITTVGKSKSSILAASQKYYTGRGSGQMREEAKYNYNQIKDNDAKKSEIQSNYYDMLDNQLKDNENRIDELRKYKPKTDHEQAQVAQQIANLEQINGQLENKQEQLLDPSNFSDDEQWLNWMTDYHTHQAIERDVATYGQEAVSYEYEENPVYTNLKDWELKTRAQALDELEFTSGGSSSRRSGSRSSRGSDNLYTPTTIDGIMESGHVSGGYFESTSETSLPADGFIEGMYEHLDDIGYKTSNPFDVGVSGDYELTATEQKSYDDFTTKIEEKKTQLENLKNTTGGSTVGGKDTPTYKKLLKRQRNAIRIDNELQNILSQRENYGGNVNEVKRKIINNNKELIEVTSFMASLGSSEGTTVPTPIYFMPVGTQKKIDNWIANVEKELEKLQSSRDALTPITSLSGDDMLDQVMNIDSWREFKKNEYLADNVYIHAARDILKREPSITKSDLKTKVSKMVDTPGNKYYDELVRQRRIQQHHEHFFRDVTNPEDLKRIMNNYETVSFYTPFNVDMRDAAVGNDQKQARQEVRRSALRSMSSQLVGGEGKLTTSDIPPQAIVGYRLFKGNVELNIDITKMPGYDKEGSNKWKYTIGTSDFTLDKNNTNIKFYDQSLDKDLSSDLTLGIPTDEWVKYSDYSAMKGREFQLYTDDNRLYDIVLIENGKEVKRIENKQVPAEALIQAGDNWSKGGNLSFE